jgi:hypothetical protein
VNVPTSTTLRAPTIPTNSANSDPWSADTCIPEERPVRSAVSAISARCNESG